MIISTREFVTQINDPPKAWEGRDIYVMNARTNEIHAVVKVQKVNLKAKRETVWAVDKMSL